MENSNRNQEENLGNAYNGSANPAQTRETRMTMFQNARDLEIDGGEFTMTGGDEYQGSPVGGYRPRPQLENTYLSSFEGVQGVRIRGGTFRAVAGDIIHASPTPTMMRSATTDGSRNFTPMFSPVNNRGARGVPRGRYGDNSSSFPGRGNTLGAAPVDIAHQYGPPPGHGAGPTYRPDGRAAPRSRQYNERTRTILQNYSVWSSENNRIIHQLPLTDDLEDEEVDEQSSPPTTMLEIDPSEEPRNVHRSNTF
ncbi:hypothetical protein HYPSUDRAFT_78655 [Hypholoma sublateritium FD-334 SS-4]|uniref:Uncharacterized protein n=1 Tax=Hypholoma sublateritium (strain FD-334 SS-4) TaxID=945553 RepID=A0A0D2PI78_HYPSF|nr:hypothetical protein HYPSUDRAFT_78655 [Hypholoma sublateritium FD-334 SS-4]